MVSLIYRRFMLGKKGVRKYFSKNPDSNSVTHLLLGIGIGVLVTYPYVGSHPVRWGFGFLAAGALGYLMAYKK